MSRNRPLCALLTLGLLLAPAPALAKGGKRNGKDGKRDEDIALTGFKSLDKVLRDVRDIDERVDGAEIAMTIAKRDLNTALGLKRGTPLKDGIAELKLTGGDALSVVMDGNVPKLTASDLAPTNVVDAATAVNGLCAALVTSIEDMAGIPAEVESLQAAVKDLPDKAKAEFAGDPLGALFKAPKLMKSLKGNLAVTTGLPERSVDVGKRAAGIVSLVQTEFKPGEGGGRGGGGDGPRGRR